MLYIIPTPIGNLRDITLRALDVLKEVDLILAEDTRVSQKLLHQYQIQKPITPYHQHNEHKVVVHLADQLQEGKRMALLTDAGTPGISDPAFLLVRECIRRNLPFESLPGPTAFVPALLNSGLPIHRFTFEGFLPLKKGRLSRLKALSVEPRTMVFYESPLRLVKTLEDLAATFGPHRPCAVCRELTKIFEETRHGNLLELASYYREKPPKGEIVLIVGGHEDAAKLDDTNKQQA